MYALINFPQTDKCKVFYVGESSVCGTPPYSHGTCQALNFEKNYSEILVFSLKEKCHDENTPDMQCKINLTTNYKQQCICTNE
jgi:hypothetical protein